MMAWVRLVSLFWLFLAPVAQAAELPALYSVTGVASDDVLNVRAGPSASEPIIGALAYTQTGVEVTAISGNWGRVNLGEGAGWASMSFLAAEPAGALPDVPELSCFGTEPFWSMDIVQSDIASFGALGSPIVTFLAGRIVPASGVIGRYGLNAAGPDDRAAVSIRAQTCSDGMSDRLYGLAADVILSGAQTGVYSGCCTIAPQ